MIEAVNSVVASAPFLRGNAEQVSTARSFTADPLAVRSVARAPVAPYTSPHVSVDVHSGKAVLQLRDPDTGNVLTQFPSETTLEHRQRLEAAAELAKAPVRTPAAEREQSAPVAHDAAPVAQAQKIDLPAPSAPSAPQASGAAQAAIAALSTGAQAGQVTPTTVDVTA